MRRKLRYVRLSEVEERNLEKLSEELGCQRSEALRFAFSTFMLQNSKGGHDLRGEESDTAARQVERS
jgi:hypothetical protein